MFSLLHRLYDVIPSFPVYDWSLAFSLSYSVSCYLGVYIYIEIHVHIYVTC